MASTEIATLRKSVEGEVLTLYSGTATSNGSTGSFDVSGYKSAVFVLKVTGVSGTSPSLTVKIDNVDPVTNETDTCVTFSAVSTIGSQWKYSFDTGKSLSNFIRVSWTITGTSPSFTFTVVAHLKHN